jgi:hypothetical protein
MKYMVLETFEGDLISEILLETNDLEEAKEKGRHNAERLTSEGHDDYSVKLLQVVDVWSSE